MEDGSWWTTSARTHSELLEMRSCPARSHNTTQSPSLRAESLHDHCLRADWSRLFSQLECARVATTATSLTPVICNRAFAGYRASIHQLPCQQALLPPRRKDELRSVRTSDHNA